LFRVAAATPIVREFTLVAGLLIVIHSAEVVIIVKRRQFSSKTSLGLERRQNDIRETWVYLSHQNQMNKNILSNFKLTVSQASKLINSP